ncbi:MAG: helix-turn-helix transcriptional regulator [Erysipelotrichaceae bacterium]|nr:helix-turn-helix transcriptional regulator [Erysipelotrichaceae bacterium]
MSFAEKLKQLRQETGISQAKLAEEIYVSRSAIAKWENGLGIPNDESLRMLAEYFGITEEELLLDKASEQIIVSKNQTIEDQQKIIVGLVAGSGIGLMILGYLFIEPLRENISMIAIGIILILFGVFNLKGNIDSIHWYNRRKVTKENQIPYCRLHGFGSIIIGSVMIISAIVQAVGYVEIGGLITLAGVIIGLSLMLYAQFKYNKGIF